MGCFKVTGYIMKLDFYFLKNFQILCHLGGMYLLAVKHKIYICIYPDAQEAIRMKLNRYSFMYVFTLLYIYLKGVI